MKNSIWLVALVLSFASYGFLSFNANTATKSFPSQDENNQIEIPQNVQLLLDRSCLPCHGADGSGKAKMKWNYEKMGDYSKSKIISKLSKISEVVAEKDMPPPKKIKKKPELKLTSEEREVLSSWADGTAESLVGG